MLTTLSIRDVVLIQRLELSFKPGLTVLTGETGAGKSILLDALGLALGGRADGRMIRHGADQATVTAEFDLPKAHPSFFILKEQGLESDGSLILRRVVSADGRSRAFVNDQPVGVGLLRQLGETLIEVHGQFETQGLLNRETHRRVLDGYGGSEKHLQAVAETYKLWQQTLQEQIRVKEETLQARKEEEFLRHAVEELDELSPQKGEETKLAEQRLLLSHAGKVHEALESVLFDLSGDQGADRRLASAQRVLVRLADKAGPQVERILAALDRAAAEMSEAQASLQSLQQTLDANPTTLEKIEERLFGLRALARKHNVQVDELADVRERLARRLMLLTNQEEQLSALARQESQLRQAYAEAAKVLTSARQKFAQQLDKMVAKELAPLKMEKSQFTTTIEPLPETEWGPEGADRVTFTVSTNPNAPPGPLNKIASGGELARFMLALKVVLARVNPVPVLVFDEVDTGIGGAVAAAVGQRLMHLAEGVQVLVVTHSPQVAARGQNHLYVRKKTSGQSAVTEVSALNAQERLEEVARMLSGATVTDQARAAARSLLETGT